MKSLSTHILIATFLISFNLGQTAFGSGAVWDLTSYTYYAEQISQYADQLEEMKKTVGTLEDTLDAVDDVKKTTEGTYNSLTGVYNRGQGYVNRYKRIEAMLDQKPRTMEGQYRKWMRVGNSGVNLSKKGINLAEDPEKALDLNFRDPRDPLYDYLGELDRRYQFRQTALKNNIGAAQSILADLSKDGGSLKRAKSLASQIDGTKNAKDSQDLTNAFLSEIVAILNQLLELTAHLGEAQGMLDFTGADDKVMKDRVKVINTRDQRAKERQEALIKKLKDERERVRSEAMYPIREGAI